MKSIDFAEYTKEIQVKSDEFDLEYYEQCLAGLGLDREAYLVARIDASRLEIKFWEPDHNRAAEYLSKLAS